MFCVIRAHWRRFADGKFLLLRNLELTGLKPRKGRRSGNPGRAKQAWGSDPKMIKAPGVTVRSRSANQLPSASVNIVSCWNKVDFDERHLISIVRIAAPLRGLDAVLAVSPRLAPRARGYRFCAPAGLRTSFSGPAASSELDAFLRQAARFKKSPLNFDYLLNFEG